MGGRKKKVDLFVRPSKTRSAPGKPRDITQARQTEAKMKSKRARESVAMSKSDGSPVVASEEPPAKKRKSSDDDRTEARTTKKRKKDKKEKKDRKEMRKEKKEKRRDLQDLPGEDAEPALAVDMVKNDKVKEEKKKKDDKSKSNMNKKKIKDGIDADGHIRIEEQEPTTTSGEGGTGHGETAEGEEKKKKKKKTAMAMTQNKKEKPSRTEKEGSGATDEHDADGDNTEAKANDGQPKKSKRTPQQPPMPATEPPSSDGGAAAKPGRHTVFVGNLPYAATTAGVAAHFAPLQPVAVRCLTARDEAATGRGVAFVEFASAAAQRACLDRFHHSLYDDGVAPPRKINVELSAGGGGTAKHRHDKIRTKNKKLDENRAKRIEREKAAKLESAAGKQAPPPPQNAIGDSIHPSRLARNPRLGT